MIPFLPTGLFCCWFFFTAVNTSIFGASFGASHSLLSVKNGCFKTLKVGKKKDHVLYILSCYCLLVLPLIFGGIEHSFFPIFFIFFYRNIRIINWILIPKKTYFYEQIIIMYWKDINSIIWDCKEVYRGYIRSEAYDKRTNKGPWFICFVIKIIEWALSEKKNNVRYRVICNWFVVAFVGIVRSLSRHDKTRQRTFVVARWRTVTNTDQCRVLRQMHRYRTLSHLVVSVCRPPLFAVPHCK